MRLFSSTVIMFTLKGFALGGFLGVAFAEALKFQAAKSNRAMVNTFIPSNNANDGSCVSFNITLSEACALQQFYDETADTLSKLMIAALVICPAVCAFLGFLYGLSVASSEVITKAVDNVAKTPRLGSSNDGEENPSLRRRVRPTDTQDRILNADEETAVPTESTPLRLSNG